MTETMKPYVHLKMDIQTKGVGGDALADKKQKRYHHLHIHTVNISGGTKYDTFTIRPTLVMQCTV